MATSTRPAPKRRRTGRVGSAFFAVSFVAALLVPGVAHAATRDIKVTFTNTSDRALDLTNTDLPHGCWGAGSPPSTIEVDATVVIASESCGVATGTEFTLTYELRGDGRKLTVHYDNPFAGTDEFNETAPIGYLFSAGGAIENRIVTFACDSTTCDGIADDWKRNGVTVDPDGPAGPQFVDLPHMGVQLDRPNVFVHLDWMDDGVAGHNQQLRQAAIDRVIRAYDQVPVTYRGATRPGINLVIDEGPGSTITPGGATWGALSRAGALPWSQGLLTGWRDPGYDETKMYDLVRTRLAPAGRLPIFHYGIAPSYIVPSRKDAKGLDEYDSTSGLARSWWFIVSLGGWTGGTGSDNEQTGTLLHEFGHSLGLKHGGEDDGQYKPNYPSVMNYLFQTNGVPTGASVAFDYSRITTPDLAEATVTEAGGVSLGAAAGTLGTGHRCSDGKGGFTSVVVAALSPIDWSCDGKSNTAGAGFDVNGENGQTVLTGSTSDWSRLQFKRGGVGLGKNPEAFIPAAGMTGPVRELTVEEAKTIAPLDNVAPVTTVQRVPSANADGWNNGPVTLTFSATDNASGVARTEASIDGGAYVAVTAPVVISTEGVHSVAYRSIDLAQNIESTNTTVVRIDLTKPTTVGTSSPPANGAGWNKGPTTVSVVASDALSGVRSTTIASTGAQVTTSRTTAGSNESITVTVDGITVVSHHATDRADNVSADGTTTVKTDATPPTSTVDQKAKGSTVIHRDEMVSGTAKDATSGVATVRIVYSPNSNANGAVVTTVIAVLTCDAARLVCTWTASRPPHPGPWTVTAFATDVAGNSQPVGSEGRVVITG